MSESTNKEVCESPVDNLRLQANDLLNFARDVERLSASRIDEIVGPVPCNACDPEPDYSCIVDEINVCMSGVYDILDNIRKDLARL